MPARAPASMLMLHRVMRPSIESARMAGPAYSITQPLAPSVPMWPMIPSAISFAVTAGPSWPSTVMRKVLGRDCGRHWVARTCSTSEVPMPKASAPNAPWVLVWLSPQTMVMPGLVRPSSGPITCTIPCSGRLNIEELNTKLGAVSAQSIHLFSRDRIFDDQSVGGGGYIVVHRRHRAIRAPYGASRQAQPFKRLR